MKEPTAANKRDSLIGKARWLYIATGITRNITEALRLYLANDAGPDEQIPLFITTPEIHQVSEILQQIRPRCDDCDSELYMKTGARDPQGKEYPTSWICKNCNLEIYSDRSPAEWLEELKDEARKQNLQRPDESISGDVPAMRPGPEV